MGSDSLSGELFGSKEGRGWVFAGWKRNVRETSEQGEEMRGATGMVGENGVLKVKRVWGKTLREGGREG